MFNLGVLLADTDPANARARYEQAAGLGHTRAMFNLAVLLADSDPEAAQSWRERLAQQG